jgi:hypothetical protein
MSASAFLGEKSGYPVQARKLPCRPHFTTSGLPHFSQIKSVGFSIRLMSVMCSSACFRS